MQLRALLWLPAGNWWEPALAVEKGLRSLARHRPDLVEQRLRRAEGGVVAEFRLTGDGESARAARILEESQDACCRPPASANC